MTCFTFAKQVEDFAILSRSLKLPGFHTQLFEQYNVLIVDNCGFDDKQLLTIKSYVDSIPKHIRIPVAIICFDYLIDRLSKKNISVHNFRCNGSFNVFGLKVDSSAENQFPDDYKKIETDLFTIVLAHEYNHNVEAIYLKKNKKLNIFKERLIKKAGSNQHNYLRSRCRDGFFEKNPQEFIASMANQYFCSSRDMFLYAAGKAKEGNLNHINQFILMASIYSDENKTYFYHIDKHGNIEVSSYPIKKEGGGLITTMSLDTRQYIFCYSDGVIEEVHGL